MNKIFQYKICQYILCILYFQFNCANFAYSFTHVDRVVETIKTIINKEQSHFPKGSLNDPNFVKKIITIMYNLDQKIRKEQILNFNNSNIARISKCVKKMDIFHTNILKKILAKHRWLTISKFGRDIDNKAWILVQHADHDENFQMSCLFILDLLSKKGDTNKKNYAYLYDRVAIKLNALGIRQKYGTQVNILKNKIDLYPYEGNLKDLDERRKIIGLEPIKDYLNQLKKEYKITS